ncbi:cytidine deaminase [Basfia succiniciproducens]|uniref:cytidine deaminase n=1 Tax=Basfia succiniciproducens TaxID=653940 RepID=UPI0008BD7866|nr:cytidine deaminase [Basfia succiniciproducens]SEQ44223.1 cytidine deaminase [Basfia succiniciproducens]
MKNTIIKGLTDLVEQKRDNLIRQMVVQLEAQGYKAVLEQATVQQFCRQFALSPVEFALRCLPVAACYALTPISQFNVGAIAIGQSGSFYFGANQEFVAASMQQTVHAEQSAISHAWLAGEKAIAHMVVNYTPCGHCRQFMNELNSAERLKIHLPHSQNNLLHNYLPDAFGPKDLNIQNVFFDGQSHPFNYQGHDPLIRAAVEAASQSYAPYSQAFSGVALQLGELIICGRYAENAAFNPTFLPLQSALNYQRLQGLIDVKVRRVVMAEAKADLTSLPMTQSLAGAHLGLDIEYISL